MSSQSALKKRLKVCMNKPENQHCVDCPEKQPRWASLIKVPGAPPGTPAIGAFMCLECSGSHRRLGVHIAFVRSVNLDSWKESEVQSMERGGNKRVNQIFEAHLARSGVRKPPNTADGQTRERYIRSKYERRKFYDPSAWDNLESSSEEEEEPAPRKRSTKTVSKPVIAPRAPSAAAQRRLASRQARLDAASPPAPVSQKKKAVTVPKAAESVDLLDFASAPMPAPAPAAPPPAQQETLDLFANMSVSNNPVSQPPTAAPATAQPPKKTNDDIMSLFQTASPVGNGMPVIGMNQAFVQQNQMPQMQAQMQQQQQQPQMNMAGMRNGMAGMNPQQMQMQQQMMMQQMMMMQQHAAMQQRGGSAAQMNPMMFRQGTMPGMQQPMSPQSAAGMSQMNMRGVAAPPNMNQMGGFVGQAMGGQAMHGQQQPTAKMTTKEDPFASLGATNRFR